MLEEILDNVENKYLDKDKRALKIVTSGPVKEVEKKKESRANWFKLQKEQEEHEAMLDKKRKIELKLMEQQKIRSDIAYEKVK